MILTSGTLELMSVVVSEVDSLVSTFHRASTTPNVWFLNVQKPRGPSLFLAAIPVTRIFTVASHRSHKDATTARGANRGMLPPFDTTRMRVVTTPGGQW